MKFLTRLRVQSSNRLVEKLTYAGGAFPAYNGNVSSRTWQNGKYDYRYGRNNRLLRADSDPIVCRGGEFSCEYEYDVMGNLTYLHRDGIIDRVDDFEFFGNLDELNLSYDGNRLITFDAYSDAILFEGATGLAATGCYDLDYDGCGRLCRDESRDISAIRYDNDGRPIRIVFGSGNEQHDRWDGFGNHLSTTYLSPDASGRLVEVSTKRYTGAGHYIATGQPLIHRFPGGYFLKGEAYGDITDYQGNITAVADASGRLVQQTDYYPYGDPWREPGGQPFLYSGNERLRVDGLNEYDFNARRYNSATTSFTTPDTRCEEYPWLSPYAFCAGNPIRNVDHSGNFIESIWDIGNLIYDVGSAIYHHAKSDHEAAKGAWVDAGVDLAATLIPGVPAGASKLIKGAKTVEKAVDKGADLNKGLKNAKQIAEGKEFEAEMLSKALGNGKDVVAHPTIVPMNGKGNVNGNRSVVDQLIKYNDGSYSVVEVKLRPTTPLSKGQKAVKSNITEGNKTFEVRSKVQDFGLEVGSVIEIKDFKIKTKY